MVEPVEIYTDGACSGNPGPGGWGVILRFKAFEKEISGFAPETTNNRMELTAAIEGLKVLKRSIRVNLYTDSKYIYEGMTGRIEVWKSNQWKTSAKKDIKNQDLWIELDKLSKIHKVQWYWVKGHAGHQENERADLLARQAIELNRA